MIDYKEYSRKRSILRKRLERTIAYSPNDTRAQAIYSRIKKETVANVRKLSPRQQARKMEILEGWLSLKSLTVKGKLEQRAKAIKRLQEEDYNISEETFDKFTEFMELSQSLLNSALYDSEEVATVATESYENPDKFFDYITEMILKE